MSNDPDDAVICYGGAQRDDGNFADIVAMDADIVRWLEQRERRRSKSRTTEPECN